MGEMKESKDQLDLLVAKETKEIRVSQVFLDSVVQEESLGLKEIKELKANKDHVDPLVPWVLKDNKDLRVCLVLEEILAQRVPLVSPEMPVPKDVRVIRDLQALLVLLVLKDLKEAWA